MESIETIQQFNTRIIKSLRKNWQASSSIDKYINAQCKYPSQNTFYWQEDKTFDTNDGTTMIVDASKIGMYMNDG